MYHYSFPNIFLYILGANQREGVAIQLVWVKRLGGKRLEAKKLGKGMVFQRPRYAFGPIGYLRNLVFLNCVLAKTIAYFHIFLRHVFFSVITPFLIA